MAATTLAADGARVGIGLEIHNYLWLTPETVFPTLVEYILDIEIDIFGIFTLK